MTRRQLLASAFALAGCGRRKGSGFPGYAFVANEQGRAVAAVDLTAFALARHIRLPDEPTAVLASPYRPFVYALTPASGELHEIDVRALKVSRRARVAHTTVSMRLDPAAENIWVGCSHPRQLVRVPLDSLKPAAGIPLPAEPAGFDLSRDGRWAASVFGDAGSMAILDLITGSRRIVAQGRTLGGVLFRSDSRMILAGDIASRSILIADVATGRTVVNLPIAVRPDNMCMKADGGQLFITGEGMDAVVFVYPYNTEVAETILAGRSPGAMAEGVASGFLLVANSASSEVSIVDIETRRVIAVAQVGREPGCIGITPDQQYALVLNRASGDIAVIRLAAVAARRNKYAPLFTMIPVGSAPVGLAIRRV